MGVHLVSGDSRARARCKTGQQGGFPAGTGTQVEPTLVGSPLNGCGCCDESGELRTLVLCPRTSVADRRQSCGVTGFEEDRDG